MSLRPMHVMADPPRPVLHSAHVIDGKSVSSPTTKDVVNPATEDVFAHVPVATSLIIAISIRSGRSSSPFRTGNLTALST